MDKQKDLLKMMEAEQKGKIPPPIAESSKDDGYELWFKHYDKKLDKLLEYQLRTVHCLFWLISIGFGLGFYFMIRPALLN
tara:strand:- start:89 stop:328 length:240 start_codon:yes stop_codon:yes gene_type:complete